MSYRHYTNEYKKELVQEFLDSAECFYNFCEMVHVNPRTFRYWVEEDGRHCFKTRPRIKQKAVFTCETKLRAIEMRRSGILLRDVAKKVGTTAMTVAKWTKTYQEEGEYALMSKKDLDNKNLSKELQLRKRIEELEAENYRLQLEHDANEVIARTLKKSPALSSKEGLLVLGRLEKTEAILELRADYTEKYKYKLKDLLIYFDIKKSTFNKCRKSVKITGEWKNRNTAQDEMILEYIKDNPDIYLKQGRRQIKMTMDADPKIDGTVSERRIVAVMRKHNLQAYQTKSMKPYNSYKNDGNPPVTNWLKYRGPDPKTGKMRWLHAFAPAGLWQILGTDVTEYHLNGFKVYLSMIIDFYDSAPIVWRISQHPDTDLIVGTVNDLMEVAPEGERFALHMDQGSVNRSHAMIKTCEDNHILQSMSDKGKSGDNAPTEGFFGLMEQQWFNNTDFSGFTYEMFVEELNRWLTKFFNERPKKKLGGLTPAAFRNKYEKDMLYLKKKA